MIGPSLFGDTLWPGRWGSHLPTVSSTVLIWKVTGFGQQHFKLQYLLQKWGRIATRSGGAGYLCLPQMKVGCSAFFREKTVVSRGCPFPSHPTKLLNFPRKSARQRFSVCLISPIDMVVSWNRGAPIAGLYNGKSSKMDDLGVPVL